MRLLHGACHAHFVFHWLCMMALVVLNVVQAVQEVRCSLRILKV
jgi:hypothetical protein